MWISGEHVKYLNVTDQRGKIEIKKYSQEKQITSSICNQAELWVLHAKLDMRNGILLSGLFFF